MHPDVKLRRPAPGSKSHSHFVPRTDPEALAALPNFDLLALTGGALDTGGFIQGRSGGVGEGKP